jgi:hypothetical protein
LLGNTSTVESTSNIDECMAFYKIPENIIKITASKGSIAVVHVCVVPDTPIIPW